MRHVDTRCRYDSAICAALPIADAAASAATLPLRYLRHAMADVYDVA